MQAVAAEQHHGSVGGVEGHCRRGARLRSAAAGGSAAGRGAETEIAADATADDGEGKDAGERTDPIKSRVEAPRCAPAPLMYRRRGAHAGERVGELLLFGTEIAHESDLTSRRTFCRARWVAIRSSFPFICNSAPISAYGRPAAIRRPTSRRSRLPNWPTAARTALSV